MWFWIGLMNPHKLGWNVATTMPLASIVGIATLVAMLVTKDKKPIAWTREMVLLIILCAYYTLTTFFAWAPFEAWEQWDKVMKIILMTFIATKLIYGRERIHLLMLVIAFSIGFYGIKGGIFSITTGGHFHVMGPENTFISGNTSIGLAMLMVLPLLVFLAREETQKWLRTFYYAAFWLTLVATIFTYSRGALLGLAAILPLMLLRTKRKFLVMLVVLPVAYVAADFVPKELYTHAETVGTYEQDASSMQRIQAWGVAINVAKDHPLVGAGFNYEYAVDADLLWLQYADFLGNWNNRARSTHSIYFQVLGQHGFIAFGLYMALLIGTYFKAERIKRDGVKNPSLTWISNYASAIQIGIVGYGVAGAFLSLAYFDLFYAYVAILAMLHRELAEAQLEMPDTLSVTGWRRSAVMAKDDASTNIKPAAGAN